MPSKALRRRRKLAQLRKGEHESIKSDARSVSSPDNTCRKAPRLISTAILPSEGKRKRGASDTIPDSETSEVNPLLDNIPPYSPPKKRRVSKVPASRPLESSRKTSPVVQNKPSYTCAICTDRDERRAWKDKMGGETISWFQCEMKTCRLWYHSSCVFVLLDQEPGSMIFCPGPSRHRTLFVCQNCISQPKKGYDKAVHLGMNAFVSAYETEKQKDDEKESSTRCPTHILAVLDKIDFDVGRQERYNGFDDSLVNRLMGNLHQSIFDYDIEIQSSIDRSQAVSNVPIYIPLATWQLIDVHSSVVSGQQWFDIEKVTGKRPPCHASITTALRTMLGIPKEDPLRIPPNLTNLTYSQVLTGLVSWFALDVIDNRVDMYSLPNMRSMRIMMAASSNAGEDRWPGHGRRLLQEIQLRTWYKPDFQQTLLSNGERFKQSLDAFLDPLTKEFHKINSRSDTGRTNIIEDTFQLWSYLQSLRGKLILIQPAIDDCYDLQLHEAYDQEGFQLRLGKNSKRKILWVLCRGFQYQEEEDDIESARMLTIKARVIVQ